MNIQLLIDNFKKNLMNADVLNLLETDYQAIAINQKAQLEVYMQAVLIVIAENCPNFLEAAVEHQKKWRDKLKIDSRVSMTNILYAWPAYQTILEETDKILPSDRSLDEIKASLFQLGQESVLSDYGLEAYARYVKIVIEKNQVLLTRPDGEKYRAIELWLKSISDNISFNLNRNREDFSYTKNGNSTLWSTADNSASVNSENDDFDVDNSF